MKYIIDAEHASMGDIKQTEIWETGNVRIQVLEEEEKEKNKR